MLKSFGLQVRRNEMDHAQFMAHWLQVHAPMSAGIDGVHGYVLNEILAFRPSQIGAPLAIGMPIDGIAQLWFDSREAMMALTQRPEVKRWFSDGPNYMGARTGFATAERVIRVVSTPRPGFKLIMFCNRRAEIPLTEFSSLWGGAYAKSILSINGVQGYVQSDVVAANPATNMPTVPIDAVDGIAEVWVGSLDEAERVLTAIEKHTAEMGMPLINQLTTLIAKETVIITPGL